MSLCRKSTHRGTFYIPTYRIIFAHVNGKVFICPFILKKFFEREQLMYIGMIEWGKEKEE